MLEWANCRNCRGKLFRATLPPGAVVEIKCDRCKALNTITATPLAAALESDGQGGFRPVAR